ncbi:MAG: GatB/YqeY domain-containing protein [Candidatus Accumulibacter sp.]|jgi:uncharacterized protein YqeY|nr:GatB/YqeY domain-containing protein [Accumulibacter sp.]
MTLKDRITEDMKTAMRAGETAKRDAIRLLMAAIKQKEVDDRVTPDDGMVVLIVEKLIKQRRDAIAQYETAGRQDKADAEKFELDILSSYLPVRLLPEEITVAVDAAIAETGAQGVSAMGKVMALLKTRLAGRADMSELSKQVKIRLGA